MKKVLMQFNELTLDQKRYVLTGFVCLVLLLVFAMSRVVEKPVSIVEMAKPSDFKNGNLTTDETSTYYRSKDELARKQYERVMESQKQVADKLAELEKRLGSPPVGALPDGQVPPAAPPQTATNDKGESNAPAEEPGKKMNRRGHSQSKIKFLLATPEFVRTSKAA